MSEQRGVIFVLAQSSRRGDVAGEPAQKAMKEMLEDAFAEKLGIDASELRTRDDSTESMCNHTTTAPTWVGTETDEGLGDIHADKVDDTETYEIVDDIKGDWVLEA